MDMFERATREKLRFTYKGQLSVEDLWDLSLSELDNVFRGVNQLWKASTATDSLIQNEQSSALEVLQLKLDIVKHVFQTKSAELELRKQMTDKAAKKQRILSIMARKQDEELEGLSLDELNQLVAEL